MTSQLTPEPVSSRPPVVMFTAPNRGPKTLTGTHTYVAGHDPAYVIDPGPRIASYQRELIEWLRHTETRVHAILLTHGHPDHAPGAASLAHALDLPVYASMALDERAAHVTITHRYAARDSFRVEGDALHVLPSPGHSADHVAFWLPASRILFSGDTILGEGSTLIAPPEGDMLLYMETLEMFRHLEPALIAPGHGPLIHDPTAKIDEYIAHRKQREQSLIEALQSGPATPHDLVRRLYTDTDPRLLDLAEGSVLAQLAKLEAEGRVTRKGDRYTLTSPLDGP